MEAGFSSLYCEIHYIKVRYIEVWVYLAKANIFDNDTGKHDLV